MHRHLNNSLVKHKSMPLAKSQCTSPQTTKRLSNINENDINREQRRNTLFTFWKMPNILKTTKEPKSNEKVELPVQVPIFQGKSLSPSKSRPTRKRRRKKRTASFNKIVSKGKPKIFKKV